MGQIINIDTRERGLPDALTETGQGGFLSRGYLAEQPAMAAVEDGEAVQFVVTNRKRGITIATDSTRHVTPDRNYRTVVVVTDRRVVALVGTETGDRQFTTELTSIADVTTTSGRRTGRLTIDRTDGTTWHVHTETNGLNDVESYLRTASEAWRTVEELLASVQRKLRAADERRQAGEYEAALTTAQSSREQFEAAVEAAAAFGADHRGTALDQRTRAAESDCRVTVATIHVDRARAAVAEGERHCSEGAYDGAQTAYERAEAAYEDALAVQDEHIDAERIEDEREGVTELVTALRESPLRRAITADRAAVAAEDTTAAADHWERALEQYREALATDPDDARFSGDPDRIRDRMSEVAEQLTAIQRSAASDARRAGDWYTDADQYEAAQQSFEDAIDAIETALATAREWYPEALAHLRAEQEAVEQRLERTEARRHGEPVADRVETDDEPRYDVTASLGDIEEPTDIEASIDPPTADPPLTDDGDLPTATTCRLSELDSASVVEVVTAALSETDWSVSAAADRSPFDLLAERETELMGVVVHSPEDDSVGRDLIKYCEVITGAGGTDMVTLATTATVHETDERLAAELGVRMLGVESLAAIVDASDADVPSAGRSEPRDEDLIPRE